MIGLTGQSYNFCTGIFGQLYNQRPYASCRSRDNNCIARMQVDSPYRSVGGGAHHKQGACLLPGNILRTEDQMICRHQDELGMACEGNVEGHCWAIRPSRMAPSPGLMPA